MDVPSVIVVWVAIRETEDENPPEYIVDHEDAGWLLDPLVQNAETEEAMRAKLKELDRPAEFGVYETVGLQVALGNKQTSVDALVFRPQEGRN